MVVFALQTAGVLVVVLHIVFVFVWCLSEVFFFLSCSLFTSTLIWILPY